MFQDTSDKPISFKSSWRKKMRYIEGTTQTDTCHFAESEVQTTQIADKMLQTEETSADPQGEVDESKLLAFLEKMYPIVADELSRPSIMTSFENSTEYDWSEKLKKLHSVKPSSQKQRVSSISWNAGGTLLGIAFSSPHSDWCNHSNSISIFRATCSPLSLIKTLEVSSCVTSVQFHLYEPSILAAGTWSGELFIWNLRKEDDCMIVSSTSMPKAHKDSITQILWINNPDPTQKHPLLVTSGSDGYLIEWEVNTHTESAEIIKGFQFTPYVSNSITGKGGLRSLYGALGLDLGVVSFSFSYQDPAIFVVGMEGGRVLKCSLTNPKRISGTSHVYDLDPVTGFYKSHSGTVICVKHCKQSPNIFATSSVDKKIHVYRNDEPGPVSIIHCTEVAMGITFWNTFKHLLLAWGMRGFVSLFNYSEEKDVQTKLHDDYKSVAVTSCAFSLTSEELLAIGDSEGNVTIWQVQI